MCVLLLEEGLKHEHQQRLIQSPEQHMHIYHRTCVVILLLLSFLEIKDGLILNVKED